MDEVLDNVGGQEAYSFTDVFSGYHQIKIVPEDTSKTTFAIEWGCFQYIVMPFGVNNVLEIFSRAVIAAFKEFIHKLLEVYFDDWMVFGLVKRHVARLWLMLGACRRYQIALRLNKCLFYIPFGILLGHVVCRQGLILDPIRIMGIINLEVPRRVKHLRTMLVHTGYYRKFIKIYAQITTSIEKMLKKDTTLCGHEKCEWSLDI